MELSTDDGFADPSKPAAVPDVQEMTFEGLPTNGVMHLREEISQLIDPWRHSAEKPPFTVGEMAVFALVFSDKLDETREDVHLLSLKDVQASILRAFGYYNELNIKALAHNPRVQNQWNLVPLPRRGVIQGFPKTLREFDLPVIVTTLEYHDHWADCTYGISPNAARVYLRRWLEPARRGAFRFLDLPPELRNRIYEMVLRFPDTGINLTRKKKLQTFRVDYHQKDEILDPYCASDRESLVTVEHLSGLLALLFSCKKIHREASSVFYEVNNFRFDTIKGLHSALVAMSPRTQKQVEGLHLYLDSTDETLDYMEAVGDLLHQLAPKRLKFTFDHRGWFEKYNAKRIRMNNGPGSNYIDTFEMVEEFKPFIDLARRAEKVEIFCFSGAAFNKALMPWYELARRPDNIYISAWEGVGFEDFVRSQLDEVTHPTAVAVSKTKPVDLE